MNRVAIVIPNYNMPERANALVEHLYATVNWPFDVILVDNGSDLEAPSEHTTIYLKQNIQTTGAWLMGLYYADFLEIKMREAYFAYWFIITSAEFPPGHRDPLTPMMALLMRNYDAVGVHPALTPDSTTMWEQLITRGDEGPRRTWMIDNIASLYRADWFNSIGRFDPALYMAHGIDLETCYKARMAGKSLWVQEDCRIKKVTNIGYSMERMNATARERATEAQVNMDVILGKRYGPNYWDILTTEGVQDEWR